MYKVSVIMPVYNNEETLRIAIDTLLNQTVFDLELILINDGSTDGSAQICQEYEKKEPLLVEVIHQERLGFATARNKGLARAKGRYIYFADAKNAFHLKMLASNVQLAEEYQAELVVFGFSQKTENIKHLPEIPFLLTQNKFRKHYRNFYYFFPYDLCNKLFEARYLKENDIQFYTIPLKEKAFFNLDVYKDLSSVVFNRQSFYKVNTIDSVPTGRYTDQSFAIHLQLVHYFKKMLAYWGQLEEYEDLIIREYYHVVYEEIINLRNQGCTLSNKEQEAKINAILSNEEIKNVFKNETVKIWRNPYEAALWDSFKKGNGKRAMRLVAGEENVNKLTDKVKKHYRRWFR